ncbi:MAG: hypothetical protein ACKOWH_02290 [Rhodoluna sp.]
MSNFTNEHLGWRAAIVLNANGEFIGRDGSSKSISNDSDRALLFELRSQSDVIVTTGKTARSEQYQSSKFAPIAFITRNPESLRNIPAFMVPGDFPNRILTSKNHDLNWLPDQIRELGFSRPLFEGGPDSLNQLIDSGVAIEIFASSTAPVQPQETQLDLLAKLIPSISNFEVADVLEKESLRALRLIRP